MYTKSSRFPSSTSNTSLNSYVKSSHDNFPLFFTESSEDSLSARKTSLHPSYVSLQGTSSVSIVAGVTPLSLPKSPFTRQVKEFDESVQLSGDERKCDQLCDDEDDEDVLMLRLMVTDSGVGISKVCIAYNYIIS